MILIVWHNLWPSIYIDHHNTSSGAVNVQVFISYINLHLHLTLLEVQNVSRAFRMLYIHQMCHIGQVRYPHYHLWSLKERSVATLIFLSPLKLEWFVFFNAAILILELCWSPIDFLFLRIGPPVRCLLDFCFCITEAIPLYEVLLMLCKYRILFNNDEERTQNNPLSPKKPRSWLSSQLR